MEVERYTRLPCAVDITDDDEEVLGTARVGREMEGNELLATGCATRTKARTMNKSEKAKLAITTRLARH